MQLFSFIKLCCTLPLFFSLPLLQPLQSIASVTIFNVGLVFPVLLLGVLLSIGFIRTGQLYEVCSKGRIVKFAWHLKREGRTQATITTFTCLLRKLMRMGANLSDSESVKKVLATNELAPNTKALIVTTYTSFLKSLDLSWKPPKYRYQQKIPFIPLESEINDLIAGCGKKISTTLQLLKETGMRIGEASRLKWTDINTRNNTVILNDPEKNGNPRIWKVSKKLINMI